MLNRVDDKWTQGKYLNFKDEGRIAPGAVTHKFTVTNRAKGHFLGTVKWMWNWRKYAFFTADIVLDEGCMTELIEFMSGLTQAQKERSRT